MITREPKYFCFFRSFFFVLQVFTGRLARVCFSSGFDKIQITIGLAVFSWQSYWKTSTLASSAPHRLQSALIAITKAPPNTADRPKQQGTLLSAITYQLQDDSQVASSCRIYIDRGSQSGLSLLFSIAEAKNYTDQPAIVGNGICLPVEHLAHFYEQANLACVNAHPTMLV